MKPTTIINSLLICGIVSSVLSIAVDILATLTYEGYSYAHQSVSELSAIGAPTRSFMVATGFVYEVLLIAFALGVWLSAGTKRSLRLASIFIALWGIVDLIGSLFSSFFSMQMRGAGSLATDTAHLVIVSVVLLLILLSIGFGSGADGRWFRIYSIATMVVMLAFGAVGASQGPAVAAGEPTPWLGLTERITVYGPLLWVLVLAVVLLQTKKDESTIAVTNLDKH